MPAWLTLATLCVVAVGLVVAFGVSLSFFNDDWYFLLQRPGWTSASLLAPHNGHLSVIDVVLFKSLTAVFGLEHQWPFRLVLGLAVASVGVVVALWVAERVGALAGLAAAALIMILGPAWEDLLFFSSVSLVGALSCGLWALWVQAREGRRADLVTCVLLLAAIGFSNLGLVFVLAAAVRLTLDRRVRAAWIVGVPLLCFAAWWLTYGNDAPSAVSLDNIVALPRYVARSAAIAVAAMVGLFRGGLGDVYVKGYLLLLLAAAAVATWLWRGGRPSVRTVVPLSALLGFWMLAGAATMDGRSPDSSRYQLMSVALLLFVAAEALRGVRIPRPAAAVAALVWAGALLSNGVLYAQQRTGFMADQARITRLELGALELERAHVDPNFRLDAPVALNPFLSGVQANRWFAETAAHGRPDIADVREIRRAAPAERQAVDSVLFHAEALSAKPTPARRRTAPCTGSQSEISQAEEATVDRIAVITNHEAFAIVLGVRRFANARQAAPVGIVPTGGTVTLRVPARMSGVPLWRLSVRGPGAASACTN